MWRITLAKSSKGSTFERQLARDITLYMSGQDKELWCWRSPGSGSMFTASLSNKAMSGDLIALKPGAVPLFDVFSIEAKCGYPSTNPLLAIWKPKGDDLRDFWTQCSRDAARSDKLPMLVYKKSGKKVLIGLCPTGIKDYFPNDPDERPFVVMKFDGLPLLTLMEFDSVLKDNPYWGNNG